MQSMVPWRSLFPRTCDMLDKTVVQKSDHSDRRAYIIVSPDGVNSLATGIGVVVSWFFEAGDQIIAGSPSLSSAEIDFHAITLDPPDAGSLSTVADRLSTKFVRQHGGMTHYVRKSTTIFDNTTLLSATTLGSVRAEWLHLSHQVADIIIKLLGLYDHLTVIIHDFVFLYVAQACTRFGARVRVVYVPHNLAKLTSSPATIDAQRAEEEVFPLITQSNSFHFFSVGPGVREALVSLYGIAHSKVIDCHNAVHEQSFRYEMAPEIPTGVDEAPFLLSFGRRSPQKGFDTVIASYKGSNLADCGIRLILLAPKWTNAPYNDYIADMVRSNRMIILLDDNVDGLPVSLLRSPQLAGVVLASRYEAHALSGLETLAFCTAETWVLHSDIPTFNATFRDRLKCRRFPVDDASELLHLLSHTHFLPRQSDNPIQRNSDSGYVQSLIKAVEELEFSAECDDQSNE